MVTAHQFFRGVQYLMNNVGWDPILRSFVSFLGEVLRLKTIGFFCFFFEKHPHPLDRTVKDGP